MKERPILFSAPMVNAIIMGDKTQTRRLVKPEPELDARWAHGAAVRGRGKNHHVRVDVGAPAGFLGTVCPYGAVGDRLWVRESYWVDRTDGRYRWYVSPVIGPIDRERHNVKLRPGIHMPRSLCRVVLEITDVRIERLQQISDDDAIAEGIQRHETQPLLWQRGPLKGDQNVVDWTAFPKLAFRSIWEGINGPDSWAANPWVWAMSFRNLR